MALDFPASPTNGQVYGSWIYSTSKGAWEAKPLEPMAATPSPTAPLTPQSGDMWYNTNDGGVYVYYNDGNTSQWVQMKSDATLSSTLGERTTTLENKLGLSRIIPPTIVKSGGSVEVNTAGTISFTAVTSLSLNSVFTSAYTNYLVLYNIPTTSTNMDLWLRFRNAGSDITTTTYSWNRAQLTYTQLQFEGGAAANANSIISLTSLYTDGAVGSVSIYGPQTTTQTRAIGDAQAGMNSVRKFSSGVNSNSASYDGCTFLPSSGNMTGAIQVFGYNN